MKQTNNIWVYFSFLEYIFYIENTAVFVSEKYILNLENQMKAKSNAKPKKSVCQPLVWLFRLSTRRVKNVSFDSPTNHQQKRDLLMPAPEFNLVHCNPFLPRCPSPDLYPSYNIQHRSAE